MNFIDYPHIVGTAEERLESIEKYLFRQADNLNYNFTQAAPDKIFELAAQAVEGAKSPAAEPGEKAKYTALRDLIIKSAGSVVQTGGNFTFSLDGEYVAVSEFGKFKEDTNLTIAANSNNIQSLFKKSGEISTDLTKYKSDMKNYISAGYDDVGDTFALDVGLLKGQYTKDGAIIEIASPKKVRITPDKISFFDGTDEVAYLKEKAIWFPKAHITGGTISIANGTFFVNAKGEMTATKANVTGEITATSLTLGEGVKVSSDKVSGINDYVKKGETLGSVPQDGATASNTTGVSISTAGLLKASNAVIYGTIYAKDGEFTGVVKATSGKIAGFEIADGNTAPENGFWKNSLSSVNKDEDTNDYYAVFMRNAGAANKIAFGIKTITKESKPTITDWNSATYLFSVSNKGVVTSSDGTKKTVIGSGQIDVYGTVGSSVKQFGTIAGVKDGNISLTNPMLCIQANADNAAGIAISASANSWYLMYGKAVELGMPEKIRHSFYGNALFKNLLCCNDSIYTAKNFLIYKNNQYLYGKTTDGTSQRLIGVSSTNNVVVGYTTNVGNLKILAKSDKTISLEAGTVKANGTTLATGSDARIKNTVCDINEKYAEFFKRLRPVTFRYNSGQSGRLHVGFIAQEVLQALEKSGLTSQDFAGYVRAESDTEGLDGYELLIRYSEFTALNTFMIQRLIEEYKNIKNELLLLKAERTA